MGQSVDKSRGVARWICALGRSREFSIYALGVDWRPPEGFSEGKPKAEAEGLAEDVAEGLPEENPKGAFILPLGHRLRTQGTGQGHRFTLFLPRLFHRLSFFLCSPRVGWKPFLPMITLGRSVVNLSSRLPVVVSTNIDKS